MTDNYVKQQSNIKKNIERLNKMNGEYNKI